MDKMLDLLNIEIIGIQSKLSAIKKHSDENKKLSRGSIVMMLEELAIRQEIELVGAESRKQAIMSVKRREEALYNQYEAYRDFKNDIERLNRNISRANSLPPWLPEKMGRIEHGEPLFNVIGDVTLHRLESK
jgi:hypothetical protein